MRLALSACLLVAACNNTALPPADETGSSTSSTGDSTDASSSSEPSACTPGASVVCACPSGDSGLQVCDQDGGGYGACTCTDVTTSDSTSGDASSSSGSSAATSSTGDTSGTTSPPSCGNGKTDLAEGESCDDGQETKLCDDDCTLVQCGDLNVNEAAGEECDDGNVNDDDGCLSTCRFPACGDEILQRGEECDDGNTVPGDGCSAACMKERWSHIGVIDGVLETELYLWEQCWSGSYGGMEAVDSVLQACAGDHILVACKQAGTGLLWRAGHAPRADVFHDPEPDFISDEYHTANGIDWYWSPSHGFVGFTQENEGWCYDGTPTSLGMCWKVDSGSFDDSGFCGSKEIVLVNDTQKWERVVYQSWD